MEHFTDTEQELLVNAWLLAREGKGQVITADAYPEAHRLAERGWLERRFVEATGEMAWFWTGAAEHALDVNGLLQSHQGREN